ncbi:helix-turn-helix domain-containing protein [Nesterenkonia sandarakina]|uniref:HTH cro/C1-type domain-containing protein n=1 Tax=Nesterenkonia sandarakina TaxID=272918 RepID=A0A2T0YJ00_9MICC|nr:helix-turn-helix transcriptional regulator [Nesterenkonia sandarakina]PRZ15186.1 hypothetical protein BCL67_109107 [Nesterenkonia sandarakina]
MDNSYPAEIERLMEQKGYVKQRGAGVSVNALAAASGIHVDTVKSIIQGGRASRPKTVDAVASALGVTSSQLLEYAGNPGGEVYVGPEATRRMSDRERAALTEFLLATLERDRKEGGEHGQGSAPITQAVRSTDGEVTYEIHGDELKARRDRPHRPRRAGHDPEWDEMYGEKIAALEEDPNLDRDQLPEDGP